MYFLFFIMIIIGVIIFVYSQSNNDNREESTMNSERLNQQYINTNTSQPKPVKRNNDMTFRVAGVTMKNEENKDIQTLLKRIANQYKKEEELESFDGMTNKEMIDDFIDGIGEFEGQYIYNSIDLFIDEDNEFDSNAIKVYLLDVDDNKHHVGYVKKGQNQRVKHEILNNQLKSTKVEFIGGYYKHIEYDDLEDKKTIEKEEITRGLEVTVMFENDITD